MNNKHTRHLKGEIDLYQQDEKELIVEGYALKFDELSRSFGNWKEVIKREALQNTDLSNVVCLDNHDERKVLGRTTADTLFLTIDQEGLRFKCIFPDTQHAQDLYKSIERKDVTQMSFGFFIDDDGHTFTKSNENEYIRTLTNITEIYEISICTIPAYEQTEVSVSQRNFEKEDYEIEKALMLLHLELLEFKKQKELRIC